MPEMNGVEATMAIRAEFPDARIVVLDHLHRGHSGGARAERRGERLPVEEQPAHTAVVGDPRRARGTEDRFSQTLRLRWRSTPLEDALSPSEIRVLRLIAGGLSNKEIAAKLAITEEAVKGQVKSILSKLGANDRTHAAVIGLRNGIIDA